MEGAWWAGFWPPLRDLQGWREAVGNGGRRERSAEFPLWLLFFLACLAHCPGGSVLSWAWAQAEGRARGPLPSGGEGGATVISEIGRPEALGCLPHLSLLAGKVLIPLVESWPPRPFGQSPEVPPARPTLSLLAGHLRSEPLISLPAKWGQNWG